MRRVLSIIPAIVILSILLSGNSAPATNPAGLVAPPEGGKILYHNYIKYNNEYIPPFRACPGQRTGGAGGQTTLQGVNPIKIGLLIQTSASSEAKNGASVAIDEANNEVGYKGRKFELIVKSMEGPWGTGSKQAVDMIFIDEVAAIVGSHDGRNAHLVEQATTKSNVCFVSAWSGDPTLSQAFTPWFFNCVPNNNQQAEILVKEINSNNCRSITLVTDDDYDARSALRSFVSRIEKDGTAKPVTIELDKSDNDFSAACSMITGRKTDCLVLFTAPEIADKIICRLKEMDFSTSIYGSLDLLKEFSPLYEYPEVMKNLLHLSSGDWFLKEKSQFAAKYHGRFNRWPSAAAAYSYDAMKVVLRAVIEVSGNRDDVREALISSDYTGATGKINFDEKGNRISPAGQTQ